MGVSIRSDTISSAGRAAHDIGLAAVLGGNMFARLAMHPAITRVSDPKERGEVVNAAWRRYGTINSLSLLAMLAGWGGARLGEAQPRFLSEKERRLAKAKDAAVVAVTVTGVAAGIEGMAFNRSAPNGGVPLKDGDSATSDASPRQARMKRVLNALSSANGLSALALAAINSSLAQQNFRRPPARRLLKRRY